MVDKFENCQDPLTENQFDAASVVEIVERLTEAYKSSGADEFEFECGCMSLRLAKGAAQSQAQPIQATQSQYVEIESVAAPVQPAAIPQCEKEDGESEDPTLTQVKAPLVGVFYASPSPDAEPFVKVGQKVKKGDVLCVIEAMKFFNEICAPCDGVVESINAENGSPISFDEVIMGIRS